MAMRGAVDIDTAPINSTSSREMHSYKEIKMLIEKGERALDAGEKKCKMSTISTSGRA